MPLPHAQTASLYTQAGQRKYLTAPERRRFIDAANQCERPELKSLCLALVHTGCRISEALALTAGSIEREAGFIAIRSLKKRSRTAIIREVPVPSNLLNVLQEIHQLDGCARSTRLWPLSRSRAWQLIKALMRTAEIADGPHATPRGLRHGYALHAIGSGVPLNFVQRWLGHASLSTTAIYLQTVGPDERWIASRMWGGGSVTPVGIVEDSRPVAVIHSEG